LQQEYELEVQFSPFFLDPTTPPEGKPRRQQTQPDDPPTEIEKRAESLGIHFSRGRTWTSNSHLALQAAEFASEEHPDLAIAFHKAMFKAYFDDLADIGSIDLIVQVGASVGLPPDELRQSLAEGRYSMAVDEEIAWAQQVGVQAVPTFVVDGRHAIVGAQELPVFQQLFGKLGKERNSTA
jgi:predicted DsbA family dithiol-disulfide isomerase